MLGLLSQKSGAAQVGTKTDLETLVGEEREYSFKEITQIALGYTAHPMVT